MKRCDKERISGKLIARAVMVLMDRNDDVTLASGLKILTDFQMKVFSAEQLNTCALAIADIKSAIAAHLRGKSVLGGDKKLTGTITYSRMPVNNCYLHCS